MKKVQRNNKNLLDKLLLFVIIATIIMVNFSLAKFKKTAAIDSETKIAIMANDITVDIDTKIEGYPGCKPIICAIELTNADDTKVCEVSQKFTVSILNNSTSNIPIKYSLYRDINCTENLIPNEEGIYENEDFKFEANKKESKKYYLKIIWPEEENNPFYAFEMDYLNLKINIEQLD